MHLGITSRQWLWIARILLLVTWTHWIQSFLWDKLYFTGDEPNYLISTLSFIRDGDFNLRNNYLQNDYLEFGYIDKMRPQWSDEYGAIVPAEHGTLTPILISPAYRIGRVAGVRIFLIAIGVICIVLTAATTDILTGSLAAGSLAMLMLAMGAAWQMQASRVYPDAFAALGTSIIVFLLARHAVQRGKPPGRIAAWTIGFCVCILPAIYLKYGILAAPLGLAALSMSSLRANRAIYFGGAAAVVVTVVNTVLYADQGALGGALGAGSLGGPFGQVHKDMLTTAHAFGRYWAQWFDRHHGLAVYEPQMILALWAAIAFLRKPETDRAKLLAGMSAAGLAFTLMHAFWSTGPGWSYPGRYLASCMPLFTILICCWLVRKDVLQKLRLALIVAGLCLSAAFLFAAVNEALPPDFVLTGYKSMFPFYWSSWEAGATFPPPTDYGPLPWYAAATLVVTKLAGVLIRRIPRSDLK